MRLFVRSADGNVVMTVYPPPDELIDNIKNLIQVAQNFPSTSQLFCVGIDEELRNGHIFSEYNLAEESTLELRLSTSTEIESNIPTNVETRDVEVEVPISSWSTRPYVPKKYFNFL